MHQHVVIHIHIPLILLFKYCRNDDDNVEIYKYIEKVGEIERERDINSCSHYELLESLCKPCLPEMQLLKAI